MGGTGKNWSKSSRASTTRARGYQNLPSKLPTIPDRNTRRRWFRNGTVKWKKHHVFLLTGLIRCNTCHYVMRGTTNRSGLRYYRDTAWEHDVKCERRGMLSADAVEAELIERLAKLRLPEEWKERAAQLVV